METGSKQADLVKKEKGRRGGCLAFLGIMALGFCIILFGCYVGNELGINSNGEFNGLFPLAILIVLIGAIILLFGYLGGLAS